MSLEWDNLPLLLDLHYLKSSWAPIDKLYGPLCLNSSYRGIHILWYHISTEQQATCHVFPMTWIAFDHLIGWFKTSVRDLGYIQLFVIGFLSWYNWRVCGKRKMDARVWHQVGLLSVKCVKFYTTIDDKIKELRILDSKWELHIEVLDRHVNLRTYSINFILISVRTNKPKPCKFAFRFPTQQDASRSWL